MKSSPYRHKFDREERRVYANNRREKGEGEESREPKYQHAVKFTITRNSNTTRNTNYIRDKINMYEKFIR